MMAFGVMEAILARQSRRRIPLWRGAALLLGAVLLAGCATPQMEAQWRDPQAGARSMHGKRVLVVCRGLDVTLERICEDRLAADAQAIGVQVVRSAPERDVATEPAAARDALLAAARAAGADAILAMSLERAYAAAAPSGASVGIGVGSVSGGWGGRTGGAIGITLPIGELAPALTCGTSLTNVDTGQLVWSGRARGSGASNEAEQVSELTRVTTEALKGTGLL